MNAALDATVKHVDTQSWGWLLTKDVYKHLFGGPEYFRHAVTSGDDLRLTISGTLLLISCFTWMFSKWMLLLLISSAVATIRLSARGVNTSLASFRRAHASSIIAREDDVTLYLAMLEKVAESKGFFSKALSISIATYLSIIAHSWTMGEMVEYGMLQSSTVQDFQRALAGLISPVFDFGFTNSISEILSIERTKYQFVFYVALFPTLFLIAFATTEICRFALELKRFGASLLIEEIYQQRRYMGV